MVWSLPLLPTDIAIPPLPAIHHRAIKTLVFTLKGGQGGNIGTEGPQRDNEKLEFQGDSILGVFITDLLEEMYPDLTTHAASSLKAQLVSNKFIAQISQRYGLVNYLIGERSALPNARASEGNQADMFEAYIAGLYRDFRATPGAQGDRPTMGMALDHVAAWLIQIYKPIIEWAKGEMEAHFGPGWHDIDAAEVANPTSAVSLVPQTDSEISHQAHGATARLNQYASETLRFPCPSYDAIRINDYTWRVRCGVRDHSGTVHKVDFGEGHNKKIASMVAAWKICRHYHLM